MLVFQCFSCTYHEYMNVVGSDYLISISYDFPGTEWHVSDAVTGRSVVTDFPLLAGWLTTCENLTCCVNSEKLQIYFTADVSICYSIEFFLRYCSQFCGEFYPRHRWCMFCERYRDEYKGEKSYVQNTHTHTVLKSKYMIHFYISSRVQ